MKASKFSDAQKAFISKQRADGIPVEHAIFSLQLLSVEFWEAGTSHGTISDGGEAANAGRRYEAAAEPPERAGTDQGDSAQQTFVAPAPEVFLHRQERREVLRQQAPGPARRSHVEQRVHDLAQVRLPGPADAVRRRHQRIDQRSPRVRQVACVAPRAPFIVGASGFGPEHHDLRRI